MFRDRNGHWRWNFAAEDGRVIAASSVAYFRKEGCMRAIGTMKGSSPIPVWGPEADVHPVEETPAEVLVAETRAMEPAE
jgi:uncharacterized protein YegP (UPF0339 family)